jgi:hypothetical protein
LHGKNIEAAKAKTSALLEAEQTRKAEKKVRTVKKERRVAEDAFKEQVREVKELRRKRVDDVDAAYVLRLLPSILQSYQPWLTRPLDIY